MRKLKIALVLLFAVLMSLSLFACKKKKTNDVDYIDAIRDVSKVPTLTDSDTEDTWNTKKNQIEVKVKLVSEETATITGDDCTFTHNIVWGVIGTYTITITPAVSQDPDATAKSTTVEVEIGHDFGSEDANGNATCAFCGAVRTRIDTDVELQYGMFHKGWADTNEGDGFKVDGKAVVFGDRTTDPEGPFQPFGEVTHGYGSNLANAKNNTDSREVPTVTVGHLEKGMTIQVTGTAIEAKPEAVEELYYFFPIIGVADRYNNLSTKFPNYVGGTSVIVRNDGHVLYNGIGEGNNRQAPRPNVLGALAGNFNEKGFPNYGSGTQADADLPDGYGTLGVLPEVSAWKPWYVYSTDDGSIRSGTYSTEKSLTLTWFYRDDGVIEMTYVASSSASTASFKSYVKVPDSPNGYYETILHGEYTHMTFEQYSVIETSPIKGLRFKAMENDGLYYENEEFNASAVAFETQSAKTDAWSAVKLPANQIYAYTGALDGEGKVPADAKAYNEVGTLWVNLANHPMNTSMKAYMAVIEKANGDVFTAPIPADEIHVVANSLVRAYGADVAGFPNNGKIGAYTIDAAKDSAGDKIVLKPSSNVTYWAQAIETMTGWSVAPDADTMRYIALAFEAGSLGGGFGTVTGVKSGEDNVPYIIDSNGEIATVVLALKEADVAKGVVITGLNNDTPIVIDVSNVKGFNVVSTIDTTHLSVMEGGYYVASYAIKKAGVAANSIYVNLGGGFAIQSAQISRVHSTPLTLDQFNADGENWVKNNDLDANVKVYYVEGGNGVTEVKVAVKVDAPNLTRLSALQIRLALADDENAIEADDAVYFPLSSFQGAYGGWHAQANGTKLTLIKAVDETNLGVVNSSTDTDDNTLLLNLNAGGSDLALIRLYDLSYTISEDGEIAFLYTSASAVATISLISFGTFNNDSDTDHGYIVIVTVDVTKLGVRAGSDNAAQTYYFEVNESDIFKVEKGANGDAISEAGISLSGQEKVIVTEGDCWHGGLAAYVLKDSSDNIYYYAGVVNIAGDHEFDGNTCKLCGATREENTKVTNTWFVPGHPSIEINDGDILEYRGTYTENSAGAGYAGTVAVFLEETKSGWDDLGIDQETNGTYHFTNDGYVYWTNFKWNATRFPYADLDGFNGEENDPAFRSSLITEDHAFNTGNGWINANGVEITESGFEAAKRGGTFRYVITYTNGKIEVRVQLYAPETEISGIPYFEYTATVEVEAGAKYEAKIFFKQQEAREGSLVDNKVTIIKNKIERSALLGAESGAVELAKDSGKTITGSGVNFTVSNGNLVASGMATKMASDVTEALAALGITGDYTHYVAFKVSFKATLPASTVAKVAGGFARYDAATNTVGVVIPVKADALGTYTIELKNYDGGTLQGNFTVDLSGIAASDISATVKNNTVNLLGGTVEVEYEGVSSVSGLKVRVGSDTVNLTEGQKAGSVTITTVATASGKTTVTYTVDAPDLSKAIAPFDILLLDSSNTTLASTPIDCAVMTGTGIQEIEGSSWYAFAKGGKLYLISSSEDPSILTINANAGTTTGVQKIDNFDISYRVVSGAVVLNTVNKVARATTGVYSNVSMSKKLVVLTIDLTKADLNIAAETPYGFELKTTEADPVKYYLVSDARAITKEGRPQSLQATDLATGSCTEQKVTGNATSDNGFYYNLTVTAGAHVFPENGGKCANCDVTGWSKDIEIGNDEMVGEDLTAGYDPADDQKFGAIVKGQTAVFTGILHASTTVGYKNENGFKVKLGGLWIRCDSWVNALPGANGNNVGDYAANKWHVDATNAKLNGNDIPQPDWAKVVALRATSYATVTIDWTTDAKTITITMRIEGVNHDVYVQTTVITSTADGDAFESDIYEIGLAPWNSNFKGTLTVTGSVAAADCNPIVHSHSYTENGGPYCKCGALDPEHGHNFVNGGCTLCEAVQAASELTDWTSVNKTINSPNGWDTASGEIAQKLTKGNTLYVVGSQTQNFNNHKNDGDDAPYYSVVFEFAEGYTFTAANNGWSYDVNGGAGTANFGGNVHTKTRLDVMDDKHQALPFNWSDMMAVASACNWRLVFDWTDEDLITITLAMTATSGSHKDYTYVIEYTLPVINDELASLTVKIGGDHVDTVKIDVCKLVTE